MPTESFWEYSCRVYRPASVREACLHLQDHYGLDVNLLLLCCWHGATRGVIDVTHLAQMLAVSKTWSDNVVTPLRAARRWMKVQLAQEESPSAFSSEQFVSLREDIKTLELRCEHHQQTFLQEFVANTPITLNEAQQLEAVARNLQGLFLQLRQRTSDPLADAVSALILSVTPHKTLARDDAHGIILKHLR